jgi:hypothetical protein
MAQIYENGKQNAAIGSKMKQTERLFARIGGSGLYIDFLSITGK